MPLIELEGHKGKNAAQSLSHEYGTTYFTEGRAFVAPKVVTALRDGGFKFKVLKEEDQSVGTGNPYDEEEMAANRPENQRPAVNVAEEDPDDMTEEEKAQAGYPNRAANRASGTEQLSPAESARQTREEYEGQRERMTPANAAQKPQTRQEKAAATRAANKAAETRKEQAEGKKTG